MQLLQEQIKLNNMWIDLEYMLDSVDADFNGTNGEEYYASNGVSHMENAIQVADKITNVCEKIEYVLEECKNFSSSYYSGFEYSVLPMGNDTWLVTIATLKV